MSWSRSPALQPSDASAGAGLLQLPANGQQEPVSRHSRILWVSWHTFGSLKLGVSTPRKLADVSTGPPVFPVSCCASSSFRESVLSTALHQAQCSVLSALVHFGRLSWLLWHRSLLLMFLFYWLPFCSFSRTLCLLPLCLTWKSWTAPVLASGIWSFVHFPVRGRRINVLDSVGPCSLS